MPGTLDHFKLKSWKFQLSLVWLLDVAKGIFNLRNFNLMSITLIFFLSGSHPTKYPDIPFGGDRFSFGCDNSIICYRCSEQILALGRQDRLAVQDFTFSPYNTCLHGLFYHNCHCGWSLQVRYHKIMRLKNWSYGIFCPIFYQISCVH